MVLWISFELLNIWEVMLNPVNSHRRKRRKQFTEMCTYEYVWVGVLCMSIQVCQAVCVRKLVFECVRGIPKAEQIRKVTPNSQSGAELSIKGNL